RPCNSPLDRRAKKLAGRLRREIIAHASLVGGRNRCFCPDDDRAARITSGGDSLERACDGGERYAAVACSVGIDAGCTVAEKVFRLQPISGDRAIAKNP